MLLRMKMRSCEMARLVEELAATSDNLTLGPRTHVVEGENYPTWCPLVHLKLVTVFLSTGTIGVSHHT